MSRLNELPSSPPGDSNSSNFDNDPPTGGSFLGLAERQKIIEENLEFAKQVVKSIGITGRQSPDVEQAGYLGLAESANRFNPSGEAEFRSYAFNRIKGSAIDEIRSQSPVKPKVLRQVREWQATEELLTQELQRFPTRQEVAERLALDDSNAANISALAEIIYPYSLTVGMVREKQYIADEVVENSLNPTEDEVIEGIDKQVLIEKIHEQICQLKPEHKHIICAYYLGGVTLSALATEFGVTVPAVHSMKSTALSRLEARLAA